MREIRASELPAGTTMDVEVLGDATFFVRVYYGMGTGESRGCQTFTEGLSQAIADATGGQLPPPMFFDGGLKPLSLLSKEARENLCRVADDLGAEPAALLERLALQVESGRAGRVWLADTDN